MSRESARAWRRREVQRNQKYRKEHYDERQAYEARRRAKTRLWLDLLKNVPCADCGRWYPPYVMEFDHVHGEKLFGIGKSLCRSIKILKEEVKKCEVVCSNCHQIRTWQRAHGVPVTAHSAKTG